MYVERVSRRTFGVEEEPRAVNRLPFAAGGPPRTEPHDPLLGATRGGNAKDTPLAVAFRSEVDPPTVARPASHVLVARIVRQPSGSAAAGINRPDVKLPILCLRVESDSPTIRRPGG